MQAFVAGVLTGVLLLAAAVIAPRFLQSNLKQRDAAIQAEAARRHLANFDPQFELAVRRIDEEATAGQFRPRIDENRQRLAEALRQASAAVQTATPIGVPDVLGAAQIAQGLKHYAAAELLRTRQRDAEAGLLNAIQEATLRSAERQRFASLATAEALDNLSDSRGRLESMRGQAREQLASLQAELSSRHEALQRVRAEIQRLRDELLQLEQTGFKLGSDSSFDAYAGQFERVADRIIALQREEQLIAAGGVDGADLDPYDLLLGELGDGERRIGMDELNFQIEAAADHVSRLDKAIAAIDVSSAETDALGQTARQQASVLGEMLNTASNLARAELERVKEINAQANSEEQGAIDALNSAVNAFGRAVAAAKQFLRDAREAQAQKDPQRLNPRLKRIISDNQFVEATETAQATANALLGRLHLERARRLERFAAVLTAAAGVLGDSDVDRESLAIELQDARSAAMEALTAARESLTPLTEAQTPLTWIHAGALASVHGMLSHVAKDAGHRRQALELLNRALAEVERSPYTPRDLVRYRDYLRENAP